MKYKKILLLSLIFASISTVNAKTIKFAECTYTEEYQKYLQLSKEEQKNTTVPTKCMEEFIYSNYNLAAPNEQASLPKYDLRTNNEVNSTIVNQEELGICWAITSMESIQSNLLKNKKGNFDLSEAHMELSTQNTYNFNRPTANREAGSGANFYIAAPYIFNHWGPVLETAFTLEKDKEVAKKKYTPTKEEIINATPAVEVNQAIVLGQSQGACTEQSKQNIKNYLVTNGALVGNLYMDIYGAGYNFSESGITSLFTNNAYYYYDGTPYTKYDRTQQSANKEMNHSVTIIGWDDTIKKENFAKDHQPKSDGAWIVKNSWGTTNNSNIKLGDNGYYYISYEDINICHQVSGFYEADTPSKNITYNTNNLGYNDTISLLEDKSIYIGGVFDKTKEQEVLNKVTFTAVQNNIDYEIYFANNGTLENLSLIASGKVDHAGYTTVNISSHQEISNQKFSIAIKFTAPNQLTIPIITKNADLFHKNLELIPNKTYMSKNAKDWSDTVTDTESETPFNLSLYAYTNEVAVSEPPLPPTITPCTIVDGKYYDKNSNSVSKEEYEKSCNIEEPEETPKCQVKDNVYYDKDGKAVSESEYKTSCNIKEEPKNDDHTTIEIQKNDKNNNSNSPSNTGTSSNDIENPDTGYFLPWVIIPLLFIGLICIKKRKSKFFKL